LYLEVNFIVDVKKQTRRKIMKVLVFDDNENHCAVAVAQLGKNHDLTVVRSFKEATEVLKPREVKDEEGKYKMVYANFDVVLTDLLVPDPREDREQPLGIFIALNAAAVNHIPIVGVLTDMNHHDNTASSAMDPFDKAWWYPKGYFEIDGCKVFMSNNPGHIGYFDPSDLSKELEYEEYSKRTDSVRAKNWSKFLDEILTS
jgi:CheY-like chemotaxis protein